MDSKAKTFALVLIVIFLTSIVTFQPISVKAIPQTDDSWTIKAPMPRTAYGEAAVVDSKIYVIGGEGSTNYMYDPTSNNWVAKAAMPTSRTLFAIAAYQNKIYTIGGQDYKTGALVNNNEVYDTLTDTWQTKQHIPSPVYNLGANVVDGQIYLICGGLNQVYNIANNSWTTKNPMLDLLTRYTSAVNDGQIYFFGNQGENWIYNPMKDTWAQGASPPVTLLGATAVATTGAIAPERIYLIGGNQPENMSGTNFVQVYNPEKDSWILGASMPTARTVAIVAVSNDMIYAMGGVEAVSAPTINNNEQFTPVEYGAVQQSSSPFTTTNIVIGLIAILVLIASLLLYRRHRKH